MIQDFEWSDVLFLLRALDWTLGLSLFALLGGGMLGLILAVMRAAQNTFLRAASLAFIVTFQGTPLLVQLLLAFFGASMLGYNTSPWLAAVLALCLNSAALLGETWRGCIQAIPYGQRAAGLALGLTRYNLFRHIILPQAARIALAPTVGIAVQIIKNTSIASIIGLVEITRAGQILTSTTFEPLLVYGIVAAIYFSLCWPLSLVSARLETTAGAQKARLTQKSKKSLRIARDTPQGA